MCHFTHPPEWMRHWVKFEKISWALVTEGLRALCRGTLGQWFHSNQCLYKCASMWIKKAPLQCWPLRGQQVLHQGWISRIHCTQARDPPWLWNPRQNSSEVQNRGINVPGKRTCVLQKNLKKKFEKIKNCFIPYHRWRRYKFLVHHLPRTRGLQRASAHL